MAAISSQGVAKEETPSTKGQLDGYLGLTRWKEIGLAITAGGSNLIEDPAV